MVFNVPHCNTFLATSSRTFFISLMELPNTINPRSSINDNDVIDKVIS